ncbi:TIGR03790 family protein [Desulfopila sp. IMCC35006]|uniref:TIGR03790 family protein n=1 Tax=Desulfopila sp. IMCC35006 TaxID=2569542 RepID=UPI001F0FDD1F|nr:TIGR03790 family protein [Desulfopila sp. IMCC35006]
MSPATVTLLLLLCQTLFALPGFCLQPKEVLVVANWQMAGSVALAHYYMQQRGIPEKNFLSLSLTVNETMSREEYDRNLKKKVLDLLKIRPPENRIAAIVLMYGVPLKVAPPNPALVGPKGVTPPDMNMRAAVDSELALVQAGQYELTGWQKNPYFLGFQGDRTVLKKSQVLLVSRLDGPDTATVYRIINETLQAEKKGLQGKAYFDARWPGSKSKTLSGYKFYDQSIHDAAEVVARRMEVVLDAREGLFPAESCPGAALYCGWYSLGKYRDSFTWQKGAIGYHIASSECATLKDTNSSIWCLKMLEKGVVATVGPVYEPYVQGFPLPKLFFGKLVEGYMSLGESYLVSLPYLSWHMILIGDPLYQPFAPAP